ncbi:MATE family efflux transporter [Haloarcula sp. H-GB5]
MSVLLLVGGGIVDRLLDGVSNAIRAAGEGLNGLFNFGIEVFLHIENPYGVAKANEAWMNSFEVALAIFPVMIILGLLSMPFADEKKTSLWRQGLRIVGVIFIIAVSRPLIGFGVDLSNTMVTALMPTGTDIINIMNPFSSGIGSLSNILSGFALAGIIWFLGWYSLIAVAIVTVLLELRDFLIHIVYISSPILAVFWYPDWGLLESVNEFANKWARMGIYTLLSGPIIAIIFQTMVVIAGGSMMQGADGIAEGISAFWSQLVLVTCFPIIMIAAVWKIVSWAGEPIGAGQAMTGMTMAFGAAIGGAAGALGSEGSAASGASGGSEVGQQMSSMAGGGGGSSGGGGSGSAPGVASDVGASSPGQNSVAQAVQDQEGETVSASGGPSSESTADTKSASASASQAGPSSQGGLSGDVPGGTGGAGGPSDEVTGAGGPSGNESETQGYISAAKKRYGDFKERNAAKIKDTVSDYKDSAKDRLNPTNLERHHADRKRSQAETVEQQHQHFEEGVDMEAGENGTIDLAQAEESGALSDSVKATDYDTPTSPKAELSEDGTFRYKNENDEMVTGSVGAKRKQFRDEKAHLESQAEAHEARADRIDESMSHTGSRLKKTGENAKEKYGPAVKAARQGFGQEMVRGTVGAHSPYLMAGGDGVFGGGQRGGEEPPQNPDVGTHEHEESTNRPSTAISPSTAKKHEDTLAESGERFDLAGEELNYVPGGGRTPDDVAQQGYIETAEENERIGAVEVSEDSDVRLPTDDSFRIGDVNMGKRDGSEAQSLPEESGEYGTFQVDEHSRLLDENEARVDQVIGNDEMVGEEAQFKDMLVRKADSDPEDYAAQYYGESPTGERMPIDAPNEETEEVIDEHIGERVDLTGTVKNKYGMSTNTHPEYEGAHDYAALEVDLRDQDEGGSSNSASDDSDTTSNETATSTGAGSSDDSESTNHSISTNGDIGGDSSNGINSASNSSSGHEISKSTDTGSSSSGNETGEKLSAEEMIAGNGDDHDRVSSDDTFMVESSATDSDKHANAYKFRRTNAEGEPEGEPIAVTRMGGEAGPPELDDPEEPPAMRDQNGNDLGRQDPQPGDVVTNLEGFKYGSYGEDWNGSHEGIDAASHGGEEGKYTELRPDENSSLTVLNRNSEPTSQSKSTSESTPETSSSSSSHPTNKNESEGSSSSSSASSGKSEETAPSENESVSSDRPHETESRGNSASETEGSPTSEVDQISDDDNSSSENKTPEAEKGDNKSADYGGTVEAGEKSIPTDDIENVESLDGERVDAKGVGGTDILEDAQLESSENDSDSRIHLADKTRDNEVAEYGEGALSEVEEGESFEVRNGKAIEFQNGSHGIQIDEDSAVEKTDEHEGNPTVSIGTDRKEIKENRGKEEQQESGDEDLPQNPGSGGSTAGEHSDEVDASEWEERARNWREHYTESESETLSEGAGFTAESMRIETLDDGERLFITDYDDLDESLAEEEIINPVRAEELKHQSLVGHAWTNAMGQEVPNVAYNEETNEVIQQEAGGADTETWGIDEAPEEALEQVEREDFEETMAIQLLGGNPDTNKDNVHVDENGGLHVIDFDRTASSMGEVDNADEMKINAGAAGRVGEKIGKINEDFHTDRFEYESEVTSKAAEIATELEENGETENVLSSVEEVDENHSGESEPRTGIIRHNIKTIANEDVEIDSPSGTSQGEMDEIFDELDEEDADNGKSEE